MKNITADNQLSVSAQRDPPPLLLLLLKKTQAAPTFAFCWGGVHLTSPSSPPPPTPPRSPHTHTTFTKTTRTRRKGRRRTTTRRRIIEKTGWEKKKRRRGGIMEVDKLFRLAEMWHCLALNARNTHACTHTCTLTRAVSSPAPPALICVGHHLSFH